MVAAAVVVAAAVESRLIPVGVLFEDASKCMASLSVAAMSSIDVNVMCVVSCQLWLRW